MEQRDPETERVRGIYDRRGASLEPREGGLLLGDARRWVASRAQGDTPEVGIGRGHTLAHYPPGVQITGIDVSAVMLEGARERARALGREATLLLGDAMNLEFADESFDAVVFCFVLCTVPDDRHALDEAARVLRPGGHLLAVEHVRSPNRVVRLVERAWEPFARRQGDHMLRDPADHLAAAGFAMETLERGRFGIVERLVARRLPGP